MTRALLRALLITAAGLLALAGTGTAATAAVGEPVLTAQVAAPATVQCQLEDPKWEVTGGADGAETLRECGGTAGAAAGRDALPLTGPTGRAGLAAAAVLLGFGTGLVMAARRRRVTFAA